VRAGRDLAAPSPGSTLMAEPIADDALVDLADALAGLRREQPGVDISTTVDVDPSQHFGPWHALLTALRAAVAGLGGADAGTILERSVPGAEIVQAAITTATDAAAAVGRHAAVDAAVEAAIEDAATLSSAFGQDDPGLVFAIESACATVLAAAYATWVSRDVLDAATAAAGTALLDVTLRPAAALATLRKASSSAAAVLDAAEAQPAAVWGALADEAGSRVEGEAMAAVRVRALAALAGLGAAEATAVARLAPRDVGLEAAFAAALVIGDAAVAAAAGGAGTVDVLTIALADAAWRRSSHPEP